MYFESLEIHYIRTSFLRLIYLLKLIHLWIFMQTEYILLDKLSGGMINNIQWKNIYTWLLDEKPV